MSRFLNPSAVVVSWCSISRCAARPAYNGLHRSLRLPAACISSYVERLVAMLHTRESTETFRRRRSRQSTAKWLQVCIASTCCQNISKCAFCHQSCVLHELVLLFWLHVVQWRCTHSTFNLFIYLFSSHVNWWQESDLNVVKIIKPFIVVLRNYCEINET